ncbi:hypothetical protein [Streptomyces sp. NPDC007070]|uniref:GntT/GntP/DsdX family permease n=1 Tax=Streptomyces sp. NPDC007070 TaxID=3154312 RepID=UPI0033E18E90
MLTWRTPEGGRGGGGGGSGSDDADRRRTGGEGQDQGRDQGQCRNRDRDRFRDPYPYPHPYPYGGGRFWLVKESFGMTLGQATKSHTAIQTLVSVCGLLMALLISVLVRRGRSRSPSDAGGPGRVTGVGPGTRAAREGVGAGRVGGGRGQSTPRDMNSATSPADSVPS